MERSIREKRISDWHFSAGIDRNYTWWNINLIFDKTEITERCIVINHGATALLATNLADSSLLNANI
jgi:hypothetical protein